MIKGRPVIGTALRRCCRKLSVYASKAPLIGELSAKPTEGSSKVRFAHFW